MMGMTIGKAARKAGVGVETIRFYERKGLIDRPPRPNVGGFRVYPVETVERIRFIRQAQELGFSLREILELLSLRADPESDCADVRERAEAKLREVTRKIAGL
jgi:MerR family mercuric resistance operon transcriptional regulator